MKAVLSGRSPQRATDNDSRDTMASPAHHTVLVKWYNVKAGYGFIEDLRTGKDIFCHASGLTRALKDRPPREGDEVLLAIHEGSKGPEARDVTPVGPSSAPTTTSRHTPRRKRTEEKIQEKVMACIFTAKALAGRNHRRLQELIPAILQHNGLPAIQIPLCALTKANPTRTFRSRSRRGKTGDATVDAMAAPNHHHQQEAAPAGDEPKIREKTESETQDDVEIKPTFTSPTQPTAAHPTDTADQSIDSRSKKNSPANHCRPGESRK
ncbi:uncharacterized protein LOC123506156 [Portunus trituberculatus]|uniref:uncharacterized protein LOC123506156 n=1 Tax=Portunus trituberculatus TaxID=210409 RepID=UPI001E1D122F|nr:uncharacterized protein LOC123506156 [Portunus trituberculatus]